MTDLVIPSRKRVARCSCGSLQAETIGEPLTVMACFCAECQLRTGSAFGVGAYWMPENVNVSGAFTRFIRAGQQGRRVIIHFCPTCGTSVYWEFEGGLEMTGIAAGAFLDQQLPAPAVSIWEQSKPDWVLLSSSITHFAQNPSLPPS